MSTFIGAQATNSSRVPLITLYDSYRSAPYTSDYQQYMQGEIVLAVSGTATSVTLQVQRSATDPVSPAPGVFIPVGDWVPADVPVSGSPESGMVPIVYVEFTFGWWRVNVTDVEGGTVTVSLSGAVIT